MRIGVLQLRSSDTPSDNLNETLRLSAEAVAQGAGFVLTPEVANCVSASRTRQMEVLQHQDTDETIATMRRFAQDNAVWALLGSVALKTDDPDGRFANRSLLIDPTGQIAAWYDKIHMFDVSLSDTESYHESKGYRPGTCAVLADMSGLKLGLTICYDLRFPMLYRQLAQAGAEILTIPSAFSPTTGAAHWETLLRARAIETGCFVIAPAQSGTHHATRGKARQTYGHSMVVSPRGEVLLDAGTNPGAYLVDLDLSQVAEARRQIPSIFLDSVYRLSE